MNVQSTYLVLRVPYLEAVKFTQGFMKGVTGYDFLILHSLLPQLSPIPLPRPSHPFPRKRTKVSKREWGEQSVRPKRALKMRVCLLLGLKWRWQGLLRSVTPGEETKTFCVCCRSCW